MILSGKDRYRMHSRKRCVLIRCISILLVIVLLMPMDARAATSETVQPYASSYLNSYNAYVYPAGSGEIQVWFTVTGINYMDELGALKIQIYESTDGGEWEWVKTFRYNTTAGMLSYNDDYHSGHVTYQGVAGRYYKAYVCIWGGKDGAGDTRYFWTSVKKAT